MNQLEDSPILAAILRKQSCTTLQLAEAADRSPCQVEEVIERSPSSWFTKTRGSGDESDTYSLTATGLVEVGQWLQNAVETYEKRLPGFIAYTPEEHTQLSLNCAVTMLCRARRFREAGNIKSSLALIDQSEGALRSARDTACSESQQSDIAEVDRLVRQFKAELGS